MDSHDDTPAAGEERMRRLLDLGRALTSELRLDAVLEQILETARALTGARYAAVGILDRERRGLAEFTASGIDPATIEAIGHTPRGLGLLGLLIDQPEPIRLRDVSEHPRSYGFPPGHPPMHGFLGAPIRVRGEAWGNLYLTEKESGADFDDEDVDAIVVLAEWAAVAIHNARTAERQQLRDSIAAAEAERRRWARELHDQTLQGLGAVRLALAAALRGDPERGRTTVAGAVELLDGEIAGLREIIADLRPAALDELGLEPALRTLAAGVAERAGLELALSFDLGGQRLPAAVENAAYRIVQEALNNVARHAHATRVELAVSCDGAMLRLRVLDDGRGIVRERSGGFGLIGMRERATLAGGEVTVERTPAGGAGTRVLVALPVALVPDGHDARSSAA